MLYPSVCASQPGQGRAQALGLIGNASPDHGEQVKTRGRPAKDVGLFRLLVESVLDYAIFVLTPQGHVASWNAGAERLKGYAAHEIIGQHFERFYTDEDRVAGRPATLLAAARQHGRVEDEGWRVRKDGTTFWADVVITALRDDHDQLIGYAKVTRDLSERRQSEHDRAARLAAEGAALRIERLQVATAALAAASRPEQTISLLTQVAVQSVDAAAGAFAVPTPDGAALEVIEVLGRAVGMPQPSQLLRSYDQHPMSYAWRTNQALFLGSGPPIQAQYPELTAAVARSPFAAWAALPLIIDRHVLGVLGLSFDQARILDADECGFLLALAEVGAQAIDRARLYESEQLARAEAEAAVRTQDEFLSVAAHELRTPVAAVKATAQLAERAIARGNFDAARTATHLQSIARSSDRLGVLIEDLLDVSRLRTGRLQLRRTRFDLGQVVHEIVSRYRATEAGHQFNLHWPEEPVFTDADPLRIEQILDNLLSNAVKYSPNVGAVEVCLRPADDGVTLTVTDHGIGLPPGQETHIFDAFGRGSNATSRLSRGLGLGLSICREIVEMHGGLIGATSPGEGHGMCVSVWLPILDVAKDDEQYRD
jgi:PAS domain S-box-containing protein